MLSPVVQVLCQVEHKDIHFRTVTWINCDCEGSFPSVTVECPAISRPSLKYRSTDLKCSISEHHNNNNLVSPSTVTTKWSTISGTSFKYISTGLEGYCLPGDLNNEYKVFSPVSLTKNHFKAIFQVKFYQTEDICCLRHARWPFKDHLLSIHLMLWRALCPGRPE